MNTKKLTKTISRNLKTNIISSSNSSPSSVLNFSFIHFMKFLKDNNVFAIAVAAVLSERISDLINCCVDSLIMPIINRDSDKDGVEDITKLEERVVEISGMKFTIGKLVISIVKFMIVTYIVFIVSKMIRKIGQKINFDDENNGNSNSNINAIQATNINTQ